MRSSSYPVSFAAAAAPLALAAAWALFAVAVAAAAAPSSARAFESSCATLSKAVDAGMAQPRIHAAIDTPLDAASLKSGIKQTLIHSIGIGKVQHSTQRQYRDVLRGDGLPKRF